MDPPSLSNGGHDPRTYHSPLLVNTLPSSGQAYSSRMNGYSSNYNSDVRMPLSDGSHRLLGMAPGTGGEQRSRHRATNPDSQTSHSLDLSPPPTYPLYSQEPNQPTQHPRFPLAPTPPSPSFKALGKRRASSIEPPHVPSEYAHDTPEPANVPAPYAAPTPASSAPDHTARQKSKPKPKQTKAPVTRTRVMPSRLRRGTTAYGIGSNPIDAMIIEAQQRAVEQVPVVDQDAVFVITTDPKGPPVAGPSTSAAHGAEDERYFEREEVAESMRQQAIIQTPEFCLLSDVYQPSSRLRTRTEMASPILDGFDSSDAAYERRHRKPEMMEKRQRRREKDKLEHERYKLKERVEQLRTMDLHHFRALLPSSGTDSGPELEHIRNELLAHADDLIRRYDVLLPPDPRAANGQRLRLKEWEIRREGNRFIPLTDEAASELAAAGLLDEQSAAEAAAAGILITAAGPGLPLLGGKGAEGYGSGFRPNLAPSDEEDEAEVEGETTAEGEVEVEHEEPIIHEEEDGSPEPPIAQPVAEDARDLVAPVVDVPTRPSSGALKIKLKVPRPSARSSSLSQDNTRPPSEQRSVVAQDDAQPATDAIPPVDPPPPTSDTTSWISRGLAATAQRPDEAPVYPSPAPSTVPLNGTLPNAHNGAWTELPYHDVPYEHQSRDIPSMRPVPVLPPAQVAVSAPTLRLRTPRASTPAPTAIPALLAAAEREANQAAGRRGRNLRTAEAFGVKLPRAFEEEREFKLPDEWISAIKMAVDEVDLGVSR